MDHIFKKVIISAALFMTACGVSGGEGTTQTSGKKATVNGKSANEYYQQFQYAVTGKCEDFSISFKYLATGDIKIGKTEAGAPIFAELSLFINSDGTYEGRYREKELIKEMPEMNGYQFKELVELKPTGRWNVENTKIVFDSLGAATGLTLTENGKTSEALMLQFTTDLSGPNLKGQIVTARKVSGNVGKTSINEYCGVR